MIRPRGYPPHAQSAAFKAMDPVGITSTCSTWSSPSFMIEPFPVLLYLVHCSLQGLQLSVFGPLQTKLLLLLSLPYSFYNQIIYVPPPHSTPGKGCLPGNAGLKFKVAVEHFVPRKPVLVQLLHERIRVELFHSTHRASSRVPFRNIMAPIMAGTPVV